MPGEGDAGADCIRARLAADAARWDHLRQQRARDPQQRQQLVIPASAMDIEELRARGVGRVGDMEPPAGEIPDQPGIDGAEGEFAALRPGARAFDIIQHPLQLRAREIGIDHQPRPRLDQRSGAVGAQPLADRRRAAILPDDGVADRRAGLAIPQQRGFPLIGDADGGDLAGPHARARQHLRRDSALRGPDIPRPMLDPARPWEKLLEFLLGDAARPPFGIEEDGARAGGALVQGEEVFHRG